MDERREENPEQKSTRLQKTLFLSCVEVVKVGDLGERTSNPSAECRRAKKRREV
jgi:hypothetical protein